MYAIQGGVSHASVYPFGGMVLTEFQLGGRRVRPLYVPGWAGGDSADGFLSNLRGDFPCVPFGGAPGKPMPNGWRPREDATDPDAFAHGYGAHHIWHLIEASEASITIGIDYPEEHPIAGLERTVSASPGEPEVLFEDRIRVCRDCDLPVGLHPIFRLPEEIGASKLVLPKCRSFRTYPGAVDASSVFVPNAEVARAEQVPLAEGGHVDATRLPMEFATEELLMLCGVREGHIALDNRAEGYRAVLRWDAAQLNGCLLWFSNRGRGFPPWNGTNLCLGIEPIASAFDLGTSISLGETPLGARTSLAMRAGQDVVLKHTISAEPLEA